MKYYGNFISRRTFAYRPSDSFSRHWFARRFELQNKFTMLLNYYLQHRWKRKKIPAPPVIYSTANDLLLKWRFDEHYRYLSTVLIRSVLIEFFYNTVTLLHGNKLTAKWWLELALESNATAENARSVHDENFVSSIFSIKLPWKMSKHQVYNIMLFILEKMIIL